MDVCFFQFCIRSNVPKETLNFLHTPHKRTEHDPKFFICSNVQRVWRETIGADGEPTAPKDVVFYKGKIYWLHVKITSEEGASYVYKEENK